MKKDVIGFIVGGLAMLAIATIVGVWQDKNLKADNAALQAEIDAMYEGWKILETSSNNKIDALLKSIGELNGQIDSLMFANAGLEETIAQKDRENAIIADENEQMRTEIQPVLDANPKVAQFVANLESMVVNYKEIVFTFQEEVKNYKGIVFSLTEKYNAQARISEEYKLQLDQVKSLLDKEKTLTSLQGKMIQKVRRQRNGIGVLSVAVLAGIGVASLL